ncbi:hypothetical protein TNCV_772901 [Trichonephila clavipes]|nr:hypothetical protein TNCV_772901 [Trichonephila clavipes]
MELNDLRHGVVPVSKNLVNDMLICSSDYEGLIENSQMVRNPTILREPSGEEGIINSVNSESVCSQEVVTDLLPETYTQSLMNVPNGDLVAVKINGSNVQTNGQGIKESKREVAFIYTCVFKNRILYSNRRGRLRKEFISNFIDSTMVQCCRDLITGIVKLELKAGLEVFKEPLGMPRGTQFEDYWYRGTDVRFSVFTVWHGSFKNGVAAQLYVVHGEKKCASTTSHKKRQVIESCQVIYSQFGLAIHQNDHQARRRFVEWAQNEIAVALDFHKRILFSDEAHFWLNGYVNKQNCRIWSEANPQVYVETPLHPEKLTVWCALWAGGILLQKR